MDYLTAVRTFARVVETGSFARAADSLQLPRNSVTKLVQSLEAHLRIKLLNRTTRRVSVTTDGQAYYERMARLLEEWDEIEDELARARSHPRGRLRVDMGTTIASLLLIPTLAQFHARYPDVQLDIGASDRPVDMIGERVDCVIRAGTISDPSLIARQLGTLPQLTCATPGYLETHGVPQHPADLEHGHQLVRYQYAGSTRQLPIVLTHGGETVTVRGNHFVTVNDSGAMLAATLSGLGIMHGPAFVAGRHIDSGALVQVLAPWQAPGIPLSIVYPANRHLSARVRVFVDWMMELFRNSPYTLPPGPRQSSI
ncbi:LysR substrate-binding domain-containing protein [Pseudoduganella plicata]|uniref:LysR family transcriptional regulator n=1 Tax=Pseudoduganella plicata TaxID=321984 RepID=A0A4P7BG34_9BURK|nr:LysR family transcriptional regulator [Pseudoduganella plicata]QBQ37736.1 LysR family transcriptional regulator [Pseudoduganella plicata]GGY92729.1 LysR family transcriptional regulator [Pseudoduganella plicata]